MSSLSDLQMRLQSLPKGYLSKKKINGKEYFYLQWKEDGKVKSRYIKAKDLPEIQKDIEMRENILREIAEKKKETSPLAKPSHPASLSGDLMMGDRKVAEFRGGVIVYLDEERAPYLIKRTKDIGIWLESRVLDFSRTNARRLKAYLGLKGKDKVDIALANRGISLTDNYWFKTRGSKIEYADLALRNDSLFPLALFGVAPIHMGKSINPELTSLGSYEKGWKKMEDGWWLFKAGNKDELFSEWFCSELAEALGIPTVRYIIENETIRCRNFTDEANLELMSSVAGESDDYDHVFSSLEPFGGGIQEAYLKLMWFDCLVHNVDRHTENMGFLRDKESGKLISLAPNFDNNMALLSAMQGHLATSRAHDGFISVFALFLKKNEKASRMYRSLQLPVVEEGSIRSILADSPIEEDFDAITKFLLSGAERLKKLQD